MNITQQRSTSRAGLLESLRSDFVCGGAWGIEVRLAEEFLIASNIFGFIRKYLAFVCSAT